MKISQADKIKMNFIYFLYLLKSLTPSIPEKIKYIIQKRTVILRASNIKILANPKISTIPFGPLTSSSDKSD